MNTDSQALFDFLDSALPVDTSEEEIEYACQSMFITKQHLPSKIQNLTLSKENIAQAFSHWSHKNQKRKTSKEAWIDVQMEVLKTPETLDTSKPSPFKMNH